MNSPPGLVVIPDARFLESQECRRAIAAALTQPIRPTNDADPQTVPDHPPASVSAAWSTS